MSDDYNHNRPLEAEIERLRAYVARADAYEKGAEETIRKLTAERDELLAALRRIAALEDEDIFDADKIARAAIIKAEGGK
jgi:hypothetical protein